MFGIASGRLSRKSVAKSKARRRPFRPLSGFEPLEKREVLSAFGFSEGLRTQASFDVAIRGTDIQFSELGLPSAMGGDIYTSSGTTTGSTRIGRYEEALQPILMDINGDAIPDFVGTTGVATFSFFVGTAGRGALGSITTVNTSYIQGVTAAGQILVGSQGTIVDGSGLLTHVSGGFVSQSTVGLFPTFDMQTNVHFTVSTPVKPALALLAIVGSVEQVSPAPSESCRRTSEDAPPKKSDDDSCKASIGTHRSSAACGDRDRQHSNASRHERSTDRNFEADIDWSTGESNKPGRLSHRQGRC